MKKFFLAFFGVFLASVFAETDSIPYNPGSFKIDSIQYEIGDAFDDAKYHTKYDKWVYDLLNVVHIKTRQSTIQKFLIFNQGDTVDPIIIQDAERLLRKQNILSDASISIENTDGKNVAHVKTSDNWTLAFPAGPGFGGDEWTYENFNWNFGIQESNFLGLGQQLGIIYIHDYLRDTWQFYYSAPHFIFRHHRLDAIYKINTDGYMASWSLMVPFLSRSQNQWAYTLEGYKSKSDLPLHSSGDFPKDAFPYETTNTLDSLPKYNGSKSFPVAKVQGFIDDSLSFRLSRSFGGSYRKLYIGATYDYRNLNGDKATIAQTIFHDGKDTYAMDITSIRENWIPQRLDSRLGLYLQLSGLYYVKEKNLHHLKWTEDVAKGYELKAQVSKNYEQLGSDNNDFRIDLWANLYLGRGTHHLTLKSASRFYLDHGEQRDFLGHVFGEYIFHPSTKFSTAVKGQVDFIENAKLGFQLLLDENIGFIGKSGFMAGQARVFGTIEQRYFPNIEIATFMPVVALFGSVGETAWDIKDINRKDLVYTVGVGFRFGQTKSISRLINKVDINLPLNGPTKGSLYYNLTTSLSL